MTDPYGISCAETRKYNAVHRELLVILYEEPRPMGKANHEMATYDQVSYK